jgi:FeS assembly SUF system regulator
MLRISKLTDYATVVLAVLAEDPSQPHSAAMLAERSRVALPTVSKVLKELQRGGLVASTRGARGGYQLSRPPAEISAVDIIDAIEGPVGLTECSTHPGQCDLEHTCVTGNAWQRVNNAIRQALQDVTLTELLGAQVQAARAPLDLAAALRAGTLRIPRSAVTR